MRAFLALVAVRLAWDGVLGGSGGTNSTRIMGINNEVILLKK